MNRTFALFLTLAVLLAHALALHTAPTGEVAPPYDVAHVAFRMARNLVQTGHCAWEVGRGGVESYPSLVWIGVAAVAERLYISVATFCQLAGAACALATVLVLARFSPGRLAGIIAPLLFVVSGGIAAASMSGTEYALFALQLAFAFLAYERGWRAALGVTLAVACATRPEGFAFAVFLFVLELARRRSGERRPGVPAAFAAPLGAALAICALRFAWTGALVSPFTRDLLAADPQRWLSGLRYVGDFFLGSGAPLLFVFPLWYLLRGALSPLGARASALTLAWCALVVLSGGDYQPFAQRMVPILAILYVAVQEAMRLALDSRRAWLPQLTWGLFMAGLATSALASKYPGDLGPLPTERLHRAWMRPHTEPRFGFEQPLGRLGLDEQIAMTSRLRAVGIFLRDQLDPSHSVLSPWPGAVGYLSRMHVIDALGRATPPPGRARPRSWTAAERADVVALLALQPDYLIPSLRFGETAPAIEEIARDWWRNLDVEPRVPERAFELYDMLKEYELITVPTTPVTRPGTFPAERFHLMRRKDLELSPVIELALDEGALTVSVRHLSHEQLVDLRIQVGAADGVLWSMRPTGRFEPRDDLIARSSILLYPTGSRRVELLRADLPPHLRATRVLAVLRNPGALGETDFDTASRQVELALQ